MKEKLKPHKKSKKESTKQEKSKERDTKKKQFMPMQH